MARPRQLSLFSLMDDAPPRKAPPPRHAVDLEAFLHRIEEGLAAGSVPPEALDKMRQLRLDLYRRLGREPPPERYKPMAPDALLSHRLNHARSIARRLATEPLHPRRRAELQKRHAYLLTFLERHAETAWQSRSKH